MASGSRHHPTESFGVGHFYERVPKSGTRSIRGRTLKLGRKQEKLFRSKGEKQLIPPVHVIALGSPTIIPKPSRRLTRARAEPYRPPRPARIRRKGR